MVAQQDPGLGRPGVLEAVGQCLLDDPVRAQLDTSGQTSAVASDRDLHGKPGTLDLGDQRRQSVQARHWSLLDGLAVRVEHAEQPAHLNQRLAPDRRDRCESLPGQLRLTVEHQVRRACLGDDDADVVRDDVVQFARDSGPLLLDRPLRALGVPPGELSRLCLEKRPLAPGPRARRSRSSAPPQARAGSRGAGRR